MTDLSQNGWPALAKTTTFTRLTVAGRGWWCANDDVATLFKYLASEYDSRVEDITDLDKELDDWSWAFRPVRGQSTGYSNHASATAFDINATRHPRGTKPSANFTAKQIATIHTILDEIHALTGMKVWRWGGDYVKPSQPDGMHFEIVITKAQAKVAAQIIKESLMPLNAADLAAIKSTLTPVIEAQAEVAVETVMNKRLIPNKPLDPPKPGDVPAADWTEIGVLAALDQKTDLQGRNIVSTANDVAGLKTTVATIASQVTTIGSAETKNATAIAANAAAIKAVDAKLTTILALLQPTKP